MLRNEIFHTGCFGKPVAHVFEDTTCYLAERNDDLLTHIFMLERACLKRPSG